MDRVRQVAEKEELRAMQEEIRKVTVKDAILDYITRLTLASREHGAIRIGISPRGALFLNRMAKARAWMEGRDYVTGQDVQAVFPDVCGHRVLIKEDIRQTTTEEALAELLKQVENPDRRSLFPGMKKA